MVTIEFKLEGNTMSPIETWKNYEGIIPIKGDFVKLHNMEWQVTSRTIPDTPEPIVCEVRRKPKVWRV